MDAYRRPEIALALGGGSGLRALCHIGVLEVFATERLPISCLIGAGSGGVVAAGFAFDADANALRSRVFDYLLSDAFQSSPLMAYLVRKEQHDPNFLRSVFDMVKRFIRLGSLSSSRALIGEAPLVALVDAIVPEGDFSDTRVALRLAALDLKSGRESVLSEGDVRTAARASASLRRRISTLSSG